VINQDSDAYIKHPDEFVFIPGSARAIALLTRQGFDVILITNQSAVGRHMITTATLQAIFDKLTAGVKQAGGTVHDIFFCPHRPDAGCSCRKPLPGLILTAARTHHIDLKRSMMVGDSARDIECGLAAGCGFTALVATGNGTSARQTLQARGIVPDFYGKDLFDTAQWIVQTFAAP
jgi:histidinol-phosphate phosphatase family protein